MYDKRMHILIVATLPDNTQSITEFIQNTDKALNTGNHSQSTNHEISINSDDKTSF